MAPRSAIRFGVAGWDYPDWQGIVYPASAPRGFDRLAHVARFVDVVEINSSFYRPVAPRVAESWVRRTEARAGFRFTAKAHRSWTHDPTGDTARDVAETLAGLAPLAEAGRLGALLVQFPQSFHHDEAALTRLDRLFEAAAGWPLVVEVRHSSWEEDSVQPWLAARQVGWCAVDQPRVGGSVLGILARVTSPVSYLRLHGRNVANWFRPDAGRDARYDYLYGREELRSLVEPIRSMAAEAAEMFVVQNNHFRGQALANSLQLKHLIEGGKPEAPAGLVDRYPDLADDVTSQRDTLF